MHKQIEKILHKDSRIFNRFIDKELTLAIYIDLIKAIDTIKHRILLKITQVWNQRDCPQMDWKLSYSSQNDYLTE